MIETGRTRVDEFSATVVRIEFVPSKHYIRVYSVNAGKFGWDV